MVVVGTARGHIFALRRLRELPDLSETYAALSWTWRVSGRFRGNAHPGAGGQASLIAQ